MFFCWGENRHLMGTKTWFDGVMYDGIESGVRG